MTIDATSQFPKEIASSASKLGMRVAEAPRAFRGWANPALARTMPFVLFMCVLALRGLAAQLALNSDSFDLRWLYGLQAALAFFAMLLWGNSLRELHRAPPSAPLAAVSIGAGLAVFVLWIAPMPGWMHLGAPAASFVPLDDGGALRWDLIAVRVFGAVLVVPLMEELFWRSFLMRWIFRADFLALNPASVPWFGVLVSSALFALAHDLWAAAFLAGLVYAQLYRRTGNLWASVLAHATTNLALAVWVLYVHAWRYW